MLALIPTLFSTVPASILVPYSMFHYSFLLSLFLYLALHLWLSNIILHLASISAPHHLNSYHYNQHLNCLRPYIHSISLPNNLRLLPPPVPLLSFLTCSFYQSPLCLHFLPLLLLHISLCHASQGRKTNMSQDKI